MLRGDFVSGGLKLGEAVEEHVDARDDLRRSARLQLISATTASASRWALGASSRISVPSSSQCRPSVARLKPSSASVVASAPGTSITTSMS